jgi:hypothetical protein
VAIALGLDRAAVPMEEARGRRGAHHPAQGASETLHAQGRSPVDVHARSAYVETISFHDAAGVTVASRCYTAAAHESPADRVVAPLMADLRQALRQDPTVAGRRDPGRRA